MLRPILLLTPMLVVLLSAGESEVQPPPPTTPDIMGKRWVDALQTNQMQALLGLLTPTDQGRANQEWQRFVKTPNPQFDVQLNAFLTVGRQANGAEQLSALGTPMLSQLDTKWLSGQITELAKFVGSAAKSQTPGVTPALDYAGLSLFLADAATFVTAAGFEDPQKLSAACKHIATALQQANIPSAETLRELDLDTLLARLTPAMPEIKAALRVYDIDVDAILGSFTFTLSDAKPTSATITVGLTTLGKPRSFPLHLVVKNGSWQFEDGASNPVAALSQLAMMAVLMHGMTPAAPATPEKDPFDGAL